MEASTTVAVELTKQELSLLLCALITEPAGIADQLFARLADAYHQVRRGVIDNEPAGPDFSAFHSRGGANAVPYSSYAEVGMTTAG